MVRATGNSLFFGVMCPSPKANQQGPCEGILVRWLDASLVSK